MYTYLATLRAGHEDRRRERRGGGRYSTWHAPYSLTLLFRSPVVPPFAIRVV
jgi:hypothetical protein